MAEVCRAIQVVGYAVALFCGVIDGLVCGLGIAVVVGLGHPAMRHLSIALISLHQRSLSVQELKALAAHAEVAGLHAAPAAWRVISVSCAAAYVLLCSAAVVYFLND